MDTKLTPTFAHILHWENCLLGNDSVFLLVRYIYIKIVPIGLLMHTKLKLSNIIEMNWTLDSECI